MSKPQHKVKGTLVNYNTAEKYTGKDEFDLLILYPGDSLGNFIST